MAGPSKLSHPLRVGIIAGGGSLPLEIARSVTGRGGFVHVVMIEGQAAGALRSYSHTDASWAEIGKAVKSFKRAGVKDIVMVGRMVRPRLMTAKPDFGFLRSIPAAIRIFSGGGDDAILRAVIAVFERRGLTVRGVDEIAPELLVGEGPMTEVHATKEDEADIAKGFALISALGRHDIGQAAVVSQGRIEAIEGAEGTDRMIARVGRQRRDAKGDPLIRSRGVLVKRPKPGQDLRVDLPTIGPDTVQKIVDARLSGIAAMSGNVLAANRFELINAAEREGVFVAGLPDASAAPVETQSTKLTDPDPLVFGKIEPSGALKAGIRRGVAIMSTLAQFSVGTALVFRKGRVIAIGANEKALEVIERATESFKPTRKRLGFAVIGHRTPVDEALIEAVAAAGLQGLIVMFGREDRPQHKGAIVARADALGIFIAGAPVAVLEPA